MLKFEYRGLDVMDQIASVPIAYDEGHKVLHIKDDSYVVWPNFNGKSGYKHSDSFYKMVRNLKGQHMFKPYTNLSDEQWVAMFTIYFYKTPSILLFKGNEFNRKIPFNSINDEDLLVFLEWMQ